MDEATAAEAVADIADNVEAVTFQYGGDGLASLALSDFQDGPFRGSGLRLFDADLLRVRTVTATLRLAGGSRLRLKGSAAGPVAEGQPSRWITLRCLRVLRWADREGAAGRDADAPR